MKWQSFQNDMSLGHLFDPNLHLGTAAFVGGNLAWRRPGKKKMHFADKRHIRTSVVNIDMSSGKASPLESDLGQAEVDVGHRSNGEHK